MKPGRPRKKASEKRVTVSIMVSPETKQRIRQLSCNMKSRFIESAINEKLDKTPR